MVGFVLYRDGQGMPFQTLVKCLSTLARSVEPISNRIATAHRDWLEGFDPTSLHPSLQTEFSELFQETSRIAGGIHDLSPALRNNSVFLNPEEKTLSWIVEFILKAAQVEALHQKGVL